MVGQEEHCVRSRDKKRDLRKTNMKQKFTDPLTDEAKNQGQDLRSNSCQVLDKEEIAIEQLKVTKRINLT